MYYGMGYGGGDAFSAMFTIVFVLIMVVVVMQIVKSLGEWNKNNNSPRLTVTATVVAKRDQVTRHHHQNHTSHSTRYFVTFQVQSGDRMELQLEGREYGLLVEGDRGNLTFQGTRYLGFERTY